MVKQWKRFAGCIGTVQKKWKADLLLTFCCTGLGKKRHSSIGHDSDNDGGQLMSQRSTKKRKITSTSEEKASCVNELKTQLCESHGSKYSNVQYALWAEIIVGGTDKSKDELLLVPMVGAQCPR